MNATKKTNRKKLCLLSYLTLLMLSGANIKAMNEDSNDDIVDISEVEDRSEMDTNDYQEDGEKAAFERVMQINYGYIKDSNTKNAKKSTRNSAGRIKLHDIFKYNVVLSIERFPQLKKAKNLQTVDYKKVSKKLGNKVEIEKITYISLNEALKFAVGYRNVNNKDTWQNPSDKLDVNKYKTLDEAMAAGIGGPKGKWFYQRMDEVIKLHITRNDEFLGYYNDLSWFRDAVITTMGGDSNSDRPTEYGTLIAEAAQNLKNNPSRSSSSVRVHEIKQTGSFWLPGGKDDDQHEKPNNEIEQNNNSNSSDNSGSITSYLLTAGAVTVGAIGLANLGGSKKKDKKNSETNKKRKKRTKKAKA